MFVSTLEVECFPSAEYTFIDDPGCVFNSDNRDSGISPFYIFKLRHREKEMRINNVREPVSLHHMMKERQHHPVHYPTPQTKRTKDLQREQIQRASIYPPKINMLKTDPPGPAAKTSIYGSHTDLVPQSGQSPRLVQFETSPLRILFGRDTVRNDKYIHHSETFKPGSVLGTTFPRLFFEWRIQHGKKRKNAKPKNNPDSLTPQIIVTIISINNGL